MASEEDRAAAAVTGRARENRAYVRALLRRKQPEFAAVLALAERELCAGKPLAGRPAGADPGLRVLTQPFAPFV